MATLVLTVVGGIVGGPVGAAIGATLGQQVDAAVFRPKGREGPRLAELKVQASTYGQQIPKLFGTMRVAGSVIWATDLIERRTKSGGGKGRPSVTEYSYAVSLAVALSSRPIRAIRRIWADGNLLRGASGTFQARCSFRWHDGGEDQPVDPLIASAVGMGSASGFRGIAYAVFEELELANFGNRIPSLTFEVEADAGPVDAGLVGDVLLGETGRCAGAWPFAGYAASGDRAREALAPLFDVDAVRLMSAPGGWRLTPSRLAGEPVALADHCESRRAEAVQDLLERHRSPLSALPGSIRLRHYEPERDYQSGQQTAEVAGGGVREERIDLPAVLPAASARALARQLATAAADERETVLWQADLAALALPVGGLVRMADSAVWRLVSRQVRDDGVRLELRRHAPPSASELPADPGVPVTPPDWPETEGQVHLFDLPNMMNPAASAPQLLIAGAGGNAGWRGADCWFVPVLGAPPVPVGVLRPAAALGVLDQPLAGGSAWLIDCINNIEVMLIDPAMVLESVGDAQLLNGANRAMIGGEMLQFGAAQEVEPGRWRLSRLLRGRAGTPCDEEHAAETPFILLDDVMPLILPDAMARQTESGTAMLQWAPRNGTGMHEVAVPGRAIALRPLAPVHGRARPGPAGGIDLDWIRRSRIDGGWRDEVDQPLGEGREAWRIALVPAVSGTGPWESAAASFHVADETLAMMPSGTAAEIRQIGDHSLSPPLLIRLN